MKRPTRALAILALISASALAMPFTYLNLASADSALIGISGTETLTVGGAPITSPGTTALIDFFPFSDSSDSILVGDSTFPTRYSQFYSFTYEVMNGEPVNNVGIVIQGVLSGSGYISYTEAVFALDGLGNETLVGTLGNSFTASGTTSPHGSLITAGSSFTYIENGTLTEGVTHYKVKKSFFLAVDPNNFNPMVDFAGISLIEQAHVVPEPGTIAATLIGLSALAARRRRKKNS